jgi:hypothetical protein
MSELNYGDVIALSEGKVFATIDGANVPLLEVKEATAELELNKEEVFALGKRIKGHKVTSAGGSGSLTLYWVSSMWNKIAEEYLRSGRLPYMTMTAINEDKSSSIGKQVVNIGGFMPDKIVLFNLEADDGIAENEMDFTFDSFKQVEAFKEIQR